MPRHPCRGQRGPSLILLAATCHSADSCFGPCVSHDAWSAVIVVPGGVTHDRAADLYDLSRASHPFLSLSPTMHRMTRELLLPTQVRHQVDALMKSAIKSTPSSLSHSRLEGGGDLRVARRLGGALGLVLATVLLDELHHLRKQWRPMPTEGHQ